MLVQLVNISLQPNLVEKTRDRETNIEFANDFVRVPTSPKFYFLQCTYKNWMCFGKHLNLVLLE
jgi:hypothetical protein